MDIGNLTNSYADFYKTQADTAASKLEGQLKTDYSKATDEELMEACKQFEAYFVEQMFKEMMKTIPETELTSGASNTMLDYYKDEMVKEVSSTATETQGFGLAQTLYEQMKRNYGL